MNKFTQFSLLILFVFLIGCLLFNLQFRNHPVLAQEKTQQIETVMENLRKKPKWLFPALQCPADVMPESQSEKDYSVERCSNNLEDCYKKCINEDGNACFELALVLQQQKKVESEYSEALFLRSCKLGIALSCTNRAAGMFNIEEKNQKALRCPVRTFEKTCALDDAWGCTMFGLALANGFGVKKDTAKALEILPKGCKNVNFDSEVCKSARSIEELIKTKKINE